MPFVPIFEKDDNRIFLPYTDYTADNEDDAWKIGIGALPECVVYQMQFKGEVLEIDPTDTPHRLGHIGNLKICAISGPIVDGEAS